MTTKRFLFLAVAAVLIVLGILTTKLSNSNAWLIAGAVSCALGGAIAIFLFIIASPKNNSLYKYTLEDGGSIMLDGSEEACNRFGFSLYEAVMTPKGEALVVGVAYGFGYYNVYSQLWFLIEGKEVVTCWEGCYSINNFKEKGIESLEEAA